MPEIAITFEGEYIKVVTHGGGLAFAKRLGAQVRDACNEHNCYRVLGIGYTTSLETMEAFDSADLFKTLGLSAKYRIAWVETNQETKEVIAFTETVLVNRGLAGRLFSNVAEAEEWLLSQAPITRVAK